MKLWTTALRAALAVAVGLEISEDEPEDWEPQE